MSKSRGAPLQRVRRRLSTTDQRLVRGMPQPERVDGRVLLPLEALDRMGRVRVRCSCGWAGTNADLGRKNALACPACGRDEGLRRVG